MSIATRLCCSIPKDGKDVHLNIHGEKQPKQYSSAYLRSVVCSAVRFQLGEKWWQMETDHVSQIRSIQHLPADAKCAILNKTKHGSTVEHFEKSQNVFIFQYIFSKIKLFLRSMNEKIQKTITLSIDHAMLGSYIFPVNSAVCLCIYIFYILKMVLVRRLLSYAITQWRRQQYLRDMGPYGGCFRKRVT